MSIVPIATERSPWPPGFSLVNIVSQILCGSRFLPLASTSDSGFASMMRGMKRSRISLPCP